MGSAELTALFLQWLRPVAATLTGIALIVYAFLGTDDQRTSIAVAGLVVLISGLVLAQVERHAMQRIDASTLLFAQLVIDVALTCYVIAVLGSPERYSIIYTWAVLFAALLLPPVRTAIIIALMLIGVLIDIAIAGEHADIAGMILQLVYVAVIGAGVSWLRNHERATRDALIGTQEQLRYAQRLAQLGSWEWNPETGVSQWSEELFNVFGIHESAHETLATFLDLIVPEEREAITKLIAKRRERHESYRFDATVVRASDGERRVVEVFGMPAPARRAGDVPRYYGSVQDVTEQRRLDQMKSEFVATASHELRTPAAIIIGFASTLRHRWYELADGQRMAFVGEIERAGTRLNDLIEDVLQVTRIESGQVRTDVHPFDALDAVRALLSQWPTTPRPGLRIDTSVDALPTACSTWGDAMRTMQVVSNLLDNARTHTPNDTDVWVEVSCTETSTRIEVVDTGPGIPAAESERVFDRFVRLDSAEGGTGLGLYISRRLMEAQGGSLELAPRRDGEGARFVVSLPREGDHDTAAL
jgi:PAS domain S-box-containing protein